MSDAARRKPTPSGLMASPHETVVVGPALAEPPGEGERAVACATSSESSPLRLVDGALDTLVALQGRLPRSDVPVYLGAAAVVVAGVVEWPVAVGTSAIYLSFKWWRFRK